MLFAGVPRAVACLLVLTVAASPWASAPAPLATARIIAGLPDELPRGAVPASAASQIDGMIGMTGSSMHAYAGRDDDFTAAPARGRQLNAVTATAALSVFADLLLGELFGIGTGLIVDSIFGSTEVPVNLAELFDNALEEIDRIVGDQIAEAFTDLKKTELRSLNLQISGYFRSVQHPRDSREQIARLLGRSSDLFTFFEANGVVSNGAFQATTALHLSLLLEHLHLDQIIGEPAAALEKGRNRIRDRARDARKVLEEWVATYTPVDDTVAERRFYSRVSSPCNPFTCGQKFGKGFMEVCMKLQSPGLVKPDRKCVALPGTTSPCKSSHINQKVRRNRINRCLDGYVKGFTNEVEKHARTVGIRQFRERNVARVFGDEIESFLKHLKDVEEMHFADVSLPGADT